MDLDRDSRHDYHTFVDQYEDDSQRSRAAAHGVNASTETGKGTARATGSIAASALYRNGKQTGSAVAFWPHGTIVTEVVDDDDEEEESAAVVDQHHEENKQRSRAAAKGVNAPTGSLAASATYCDGRPTETANGIVVVRVVDDGDDDAEESIGNEAIPLSRRLWNCLMMFRSYASRKFDCFRGLRNHHRCRFTMIVGMSCAAAVVAVFSVNYSRAVVYAYSRLVAQGLANLNTSSLTDTSSCVKVIADVSTERLSSDMSILPSFIRDVANVTIIN